MSDGVWLVGGSNQIAAWLVPALLRSGRPLRVDSRTARPAWIAPHQNLSWHTAGAAQAPAGFRGSAVIFIGPMTQFPNWWGAGHEVDRVIVFSSTSRFTKADSEIDAERSVANDLIRGETLVRESVGSVPLILLRPTLVYGAGLDRNLTRLAHWLKRVRIMPMPGPGAGLRQPVHAADLADAVVASLDRRVSGEYALSGASTLSFRQMVQGVFRSLGLPPRFVTMPHLLTGPGLWLMRRRSRWADLNPAMLRRLEQDLVFSHAAATRDLGYHPRPFEPDAETWLRLHLRRDFRHSDR